MKPRRHLALGWAVLLGGLAVITPSVSGPQGTPARSEVPGQTATLLPDGRWLLLGGREADASLTVAAITDPRTHEVRVLPDGLHRARAGHTATLLPDGTVLVLGGVGIDGGVVGVAERFRPDTQTFELLPDIGLTPRTSHTATLLTDGRVLIVGGTGADGAMVTDVELWNRALQTAEHAHLALSVPRREHAATLRPDGTVLLWGGRDTTGVVLGNGELFDPAQSTLTLVGTVLRTPSPEGLSRIEASIPPTGAEDVAVDSVIAIRFSRPLRVETVTVDSITLSGPGGSDAVGVVPAEGGWLAFITPRAPLAAGALYAVTLRGVVDDAGLPLPETGIFFRTRVPVVASTPSSAATLASPSRSGVLTRRLTLVPEPEGAETAEWQGERRDGRPFSPWQRLPPLQAPPGVTALAGQVLTLSGNPLAGVTLSMPSASGVTTRTTRTDVTGRFLLTNIRPGWGELLIDGRTANTPTRTYGVFEVRVKIAGAETTVLPYTSWMPRIDTAHAVDVPAHAPAELVVTTPRIPGLELRLPAHSVVRDHEGRIARQVSLTPIPLDRTPFPLAKHVDVPLYFTAQPGGGYVYSSSGAGARLIYPNRRQYPVGTRFEFWHYDPEDRGWYVYGHGSVVAGGAQVVPDPGIAIYEFTGAMTSPPSLAATESPAAGDGSLARDLDPVDLSTGLFILNKTDLAVPDVLPMVLTRTYRTNDARVRAFGVGAHHNFDTFLVGDRYPYTYQELILPDGARLRYPRIDVGPPYNDSPGVYQHTSSPTIFYGSTLTFTAQSRWRLTLKNGTQYEFAGADTGETKSARAAIVDIRDRYNNILTIDRAPNGNLLSVTSTSGRGLWFTYSGDVITSVRDQASRRVYYTYDAQARLTTVKDPVGGVTEYTYDAAHRMTTLKDARGIVYLINDYDPVTGRVTRQTQADQSFYQVSYTDNANGDIVQADVTYPAGNRRRVSFTASGYVSSDIRGLGSAEQQTTTYERRPDNLLGAVVNPRGVRTEFTYAPTTGNLLTVKRAVGLPEQATTTLTYEPAFNQITTVQDPLNKIWTLGYDAQGNVTSLKTPVAAEPATTLTYNPAGQVLTVTEPAPASQTTTVTYQAGLPATVQNSSGTTTFGRDTAGRVATVTNPLGRVTRYEYDALNRVTGVLDPLGQGTGFAYDPNGNLLSVTDARGSVTKYTYNSMDRVQTRTDPLQRAESYQYDGNGNLTQGTDRKGQVATFTYDALDRPAGAAYRNVGGSIHSTVTYTWDTGNRVTQVADSLWGALTLGYDNLDRLTQAAPQGTVTYLYDVAGRRTTMTVLGTPNIVYAYTYDLADRLKTLLKNGATQVTLTYDTAGRRTQTALPSSLSVNYALDAASQVSGITYQQSSTVLGNLGYGYDAAGHRTGVSGSWARTGLPAAMATVTYNAANQPTTLSHDENGNLLGDGTQTFGWDPRNRLATINAGATAAFSYDPLGRRTRATVGAAVTDYVYDGLNAVQEVRGTGTTNVLPGLAVDEVFTRTEPGGTARMLLPDGLGSTVATMDATGPNPSATYTYEPFGRTTSTGSVVNPTQYTGRENDGTGLYYYRARYYHPGLQRFIGEDPLEFAGGDTNLYAYVRNAPTQWTDPLGLQAVPMPAPIPVPIPFPPVFIPGTPENQRFVETTLDLLQSLMGRKQRESGLENLSDEEIMRRARDKSLPIEERRRYAREEKYRDLRNKGKDRGGPARPMGFMALEPTSPWDAIELDGPVPLSGRKR